MKIAIAGDSAGEGLSKILAEHLKDKYEVSEVSRTDAGPDPFYANMADRIASAVIAGDYDRAILVCGTGIGMSMAANKVGGIRAALVHDLFTSRMARMHNNANVLVLGARLLAKEYARECVQEWLNNQFEERHQARLNKISDLETTR